MRTYTKWTMLAMSTVTSLVLIMLFYDVAQAGEISVSDTVPLTKTNWSKTLSVPKFDATLGTLTRVDVTLSGGVTGTAQYESTDPNPTVVTLNLKADIALQGPGGGTLVLLNPSVQKTDSAAAKDGVIDFDGPSGGTFANLTASQSESVVLTDPGDLADFTGSGNIDLSATATGSSSGSGSGNLITQFNVDATASLVVKYTFVAAKINIEKTVYAGHNNGASCPAVGSELVVGATNSNVTYCLVVTNPGDTYLSDIIITDADLGIPPGTLTLLPALSTALPLAPLSVDPNARLVYYFNGQIARNLVNTAQVIGTPSGSDGVPIAGIPKPTDQDTAEVRVLAPGIRITKLPDQQSVFSGGTATFSILVENIGNVTLNNVVVVDPLAPNCDRPNIGTLAAGATFPEYTCTLANITQPITNTAFVTGTPPSGPPVTGDDDARVSIGEAELRACKYEGSVAAGSERSGWTINLGGPSSQAQVTDQSGCVTFTINTAGLYVLTETLQAGWVQLEPPTGQFVGQVNSPGDFGPFNFVNSRPATVFACKQDSLGIPLAGWEMNLAPGLPPSVTNPQDGCATFTVNQPGFYALSETPQTGWTQVEPPNGSDFTIDVKSGGVYTGTFVNFQNATIRACKQLDGTGAPLPGWPIDLAGPDPKSGVTGVDGCVTFSVAASGDYTLTEQAQGWTIVQPPTGQFVVRNVRPGDVRPNDEDPFTFVNNPNTRVAIIKQAVPEDGTSFGFSGDLGDFTLAPPTAPTFVVTNLLPGVKRITETVPSGWALTDFGCSSADGGTVPASLLGNSGEFSLSAGQSITCTVTNQKRGQIVVNKLTVPRGDLTVFDFSATGGDLPAPATFQLADGLSQTLDNVVPGVPYQIQETPTAGWGVSSATCDNADDPNQVAVQPGQTVTCTFVNENLPRLTLFKQVINDNGGTAGPNDFGLQVGGVPVASGATTLLQPGVPYSVTEVGLAGYQFVSITGEGCPPGLDWTVSLNFSVALTCTVTNDDIPPTLTLIKEVINDDGGTAGPDDFGISVGGQVVTSGLAVTLTAGIPYSITEAGRADYQFVQITGDGCPQALGGTITLSPGQAATCTITNDDEPLGSIGSTVWLDRNQNGLRDPDEPLVPGVKVTLYFGDGSPTGKTTVTDADGRYLFDKLTPGTYVVGFELPPGLVFTFPNIGSDNSIDSNANRSTGRTGPIVVPPGGNELTWDAGIFSAVQMTKVANTAEVKSGGTITYTLVFSNVGANAATSVIITDTVPNLAVYDPTLNTVAWNCTVDDNGVASAGQQCTVVVGNLPPTGENSVLTFVVRVLSFQVPSDVTGDILNCARIRDTAAPDLALVERCVTTRLVLTPTALGETEEPRGLSDMFLPFITR